MTVLDRDYEDIVRRALAAAAESIEPSGDGLQRIRHRLQSPRSASSWAYRWAESARLHRIRFFVRLEPAAETGRIALGQVRHRLSGPFLTAFARSGGANGHTRHTRHAGHPRHAGHRRLTRPARGAAGQQPPPRTVLGRQWRFSSAAAWLQPVLAASAVVVVIVGVFALKSAQRPGIKPANATASSRAGHAAVAGGTVDSASQGLWMPPLGVTVPPPPPVPGASGKKQVMSMLPAVACTPTPSPTASTPAPSASATPTPSVTPTNTPTTSPSSPTPTVTPTTSPVTTPTPSDTSGSSGTASATKASLIVPNVAGKLVSAQCGSVPGALPSGAPTATATS
jgi:hypothetical protein